MTGERADRTWVAPVGDGEVLVDPPHPALVEAVTRNRLNLARELCHLRGHDLLGYRAAVRAQLASPVDTPVVALGHQPEFYHAGVWAKRVVAQDVAHRAGGHAVHLIVDYDRIKQRDLIVPQLSGDHVIQRRVGLPGFNQASSYEHLAPWTAADAAALRGLGTDAMSLLAVEFKHATAQRWVDQYAMALTAVDAHLDIAVPMYAVTQLELWPFFALLTGAAREFSTCYNVALHAYRGLRGIAGSLRPVPDLHVDDHRVELPLWCMAVETGERRRLFIEEQQGGLQLFAGDEALAALPTGPDHDWPAIGRQVENRGWLVRPRALTLTMWARLFAADLFIHGIGGALYDQVTDDIIRSFFGIAPPVYGVVTATLRPALPLHGVTASTRAAALRSLRDLQHNPQRHVGAEYGDLIARRAALVDESLRLRAHQPRAHAERREVFNGIRKINNCLLETLGDDISRAIGHIAELDLQLASDTVALGREYFYGLFSEDRLRALQQRLAIRSP